MKKSDLMALIAADEIAQALELASRAAQAMGKAELQQELVLVQSQWEQADKEERAATSDRDQVLQVRNKAKRALIALVQQMPEELPVDVPSPKGKSNGLDEGRFKWRLFFLMLGVKAWIVYWVLFHKGTGGFTNGEALATVSLLLPAFAAYISPMLADLLRQRTRPLLAPGLQPQVSRSTQWLTFGLVGVYGLVLHYVIGQKAAGRLADNPAANFENMTKWLAIVESGLGIYLGLIIGEFFKKSK